jgi:CDP-paratose 2-epimerase
MSTAIVTGSGGLVGSETVRFLLKKGMDVIGIDNNMRQAYFGSKGSVEKTINWLISQPWYLHSYLDIRDAGGILSLFKQQEDISLVVHCAAQPSHDWAAKEPVTDFMVNAYGTLNLLEATRLHAPDAVFIFTSTNKVYGDRPNRLPYVSMTNRYEIAPNHPYSQFGIDETMSIDQSLHSVFGASKVAADIMVQEYGRYFGLKTGVFRGGCLTGPAHAGVILHGFLSYLIKCVKEGKQYIVFGYDGKQVRDQIHSYDLASAFWEFYEKPRPGEVYNIGGSRHSNCSVLEAIAMAEEICKKTLNHYATLDNRIGDHRWWISDVRKFQSHYPDWRYRYSLREIMEEIAEGSPNGMEAGC